MKAYSERLKYNPDLGECGLPEILETTRTLEIKMKQFYKIFKESKNIVVLTGAGISTSVGVPDFRGPNGVWTNMLNEKKNGVKDDPNAFECAIPSLSHMVVYHLMKTGRVKYVITQNVDNLHYKSGIRENYSELHGNIMKEKCGIVILIVNHLCVEICKKIYLRNFDTGGMSFQLTGRVCECGGKLRDMILDWWDPLDDDDLEVCENHCKKADLLICLGTSLRVQPVNGFTELTYKNSGKVIIVNLQETPYDDVACLKVHYYCDDVLRMLMFNLQENIPPYFLYSNFKVRIKGNNDKYNLKITDEDGFKCCYFECIKVISKNGTKKECILTEEPFEMDINKNSNCKLIDILIICKKQFNNKEYLIENLEIKEMVKSYKFLVIRKSYSIRTKRKRIVTKENKKKKRKPNE